MPLCLEQRRYISLSSAETWQLLHQLTSKGLAPAEAVEQVALVNYIARQEHLDARQVTETLLIW